MIPISPQLSKVILAFLMLIPWMVLYQKNIFPHLAQTGFDGEVITLIEILFIILIAIFGKHPRFSKQGIYLFTAISLWHISGLCSAFFSEHAYASLIKQIHYIIHCMFIYCVWIFISQTEKQHKLAWFLIFTFVWLVYYIYSAWFIQPDPFYVNWAKSTPFFNNIRHSGFVLILFLPLLFIPLFSNLKYKLFITALLLSLYWGFVIWTCSRGVYFSALISIGLISFYFKSVPRIHFLILISFLIGWIIAFQFPTSTETFNPFRLWFLTFGDTSLGDIRITSGRSGIWSTTLSKFSEHNIFIGLGADGYKYLTPKMVNDSVHPHNSFIQLLSEYGIIGLSMILLTAISFLGHWKNTHQNIKPTNLMILSRIGVVTFLIASLVDGHFYYDFSLIYVGILIALSLQPATNINPSKVKVIPIALVIAVSLTLIPLNEHWKTYIAQQTDLLDQEQLDQVTKFPSYYHPTNWLYSNYSKKQLKENAINLGKKIGPSHCNFYLIDYKENRKSTQLIADIEEVCRKVDLKKFSITDFKGELSSER